MFNRANAGRKRSARPALDALESREMLSTASGHARVSALHAHSQAHVSILAQLPVSPTRTASTVPANGDQNPYGVAFVPERGRQGGRAPPRRRPGQQLQQRTRPRPPGRHRQPPGDRHDHRPGRGRRHASRSSTRGRRASGSATAWPS